jgi:hypothetical protein
MTMNSFDAIFYTLSFVVPGFICYSTMAIFVPRKAEDTELSLLRFLTLSCLNYALWAWLIYLLAKSEFFTGSPLLSATAWGLIIFVSPVLLGVIFGKLSSRDWLRRFLMRMGLEPLHPIPTAWDYYFSRTPPVWLLVTLKDGSKVGGFFGKKSFASSAAGERDLFIEEIFKVIEDGEWQPIPRNNGIYIKGEEIKHIEIWRTEEEARNG